MTVREPLTMCMAVFAHYYFCYDFDDDDDALLFVHVILSSNPS